MRLFSFFTLLCVTLALLSQLPAPALAARQVESDLYKRLGVRRKASDREIKKAYRNLSRRWHPDRNSHREAFATKKFREVAEAYEVLSDAEKRKEYDLGGGPHHGFPEGQGPGGPGGFGGGPGGPGGGQRFSFNMGGGDPGGGSGGFGGFGDIFGSMFGDMGGGGPGGPGGGGPNMGGGGRRGPGMGGMGGMGGGGGGARRRAPPRQPSAPPTKVDFSVPLTDLLRDSTAKVRHGGRAHQVKVPAGSLEGAEFPAQGDPSVLFVLRAPADESRFTREPGSGELVFRAKVSLTEALSGKAVVKVPLLEGGRVIQVPVYSVISPQTVKMLPAQGLPRPPKAKGGRRRAKEPERGDLRIKFDIEFPAKLTPGQFKRIKAVLEEVEDKK